MRRHGGCASRPRFGGSTSRQSSAPRACFEIEAPPAWRLDIPIVSTRDQQRHRDRHARGMIAACRLTGRLLEDAARRRVRRGCGGRRCHADAARRGHRRDRRCLLAGLIPRDRTDITPVTSSALAHTEQENRLRASVEDALSGAECSSPVPPSVSTSPVARGRTAVACSRWPNPDPEVDPRCRPPPSRSLPPARSDYPNQINNVLAFRASFKGALAVRSPRITAGMKRAAPTRSPDSSPTASWSARPRHPDRVRPPRPPAGG